VDGLIADPELGILAAIGQGRGMHLWQVSTARELAWVSESAGRKAVARFSRYGEVAVWADGNILLFDLRDGEVKRRIRDCSNSFSELSYSSDGRLLAAVESHAVSVYDVASAQLVEYIRLPVTCAGLRCGAFGARGRLLVAGSSDGRLFEWDLRTRKLVSERRADCGEIVSIACSPSGKTLVCGNADTTALVWELDETRLGLGGFPGAGELSEAQLSSLWNDLRTREAHLAYQSTWSLIACPRRSVPYLATQLRPVSRLDQERVGRCIRDLGADSFRTREEAFQALQALGDGALPALRRRLEEKPSLEERRRILALLREGKNFSPEELRSLRAIHVLEQIGTPEAEAILDKLASGAHESRLTQEAALSGSRLREVRRLMQR
jgi:hypothetical protein